jgi:hypothetical protein|tara:strand:- start:712 stop:1257 length:546 start_codon:yes stop_codon:yes gene_type:complete
MTPIEDAWNIKDTTSKDTTSKYTTSNDTTSNPYVLLESNQNRLQAAISTSNPNIVPYNNDMAYDEYIINVESFKPLRIDITIKDKELIAHLRTLSHEDQQKKATEILLNYYRGNQIAETDTLRKELSHAQSSEEESYGFVQEEPKIEYFKSDKPDNTFLYIILALLVFMLYEKLGLMTQHA